MSEDKLLKARVLGDQAKNLMNDEAFTQSVEAVKAEIIKLWTSSKSPEERERAWQALHLAEKITDAIATTYNNGKLANIELEEIIAVRERRKIFGVI